MRRDARWKEVSFVFHPIHNGTLPPTSQCQDVVESGSLTTNSLTTSDIVSISQVTYIIGECECRAAESVTFLFAALQFAAER